MTRRLNLDYRTKIRNIPRRIRALNRWAEAFNDARLAVFPQEQRFWNYKIPVCTNLVGGKHSKQKTKADCAQALINACSNLMLATADWNSRPRITAAICLPDMFISEVCLYHCEDYYQEHISEYSSENVSTVILRELSLAEEWGLILPEGIQELGLAIDYNGGDDPHYRFTGERWYYGQLT